MQCPAHPDAKLRDVLTRKGVIVDACPECNGVWLDGGEIYQFSRDPRKLEPELLARQEEAKPSDRKCPRCKIDMRTFPFLTNSLEVETCPECDGMWFDPGELEKALSEERHLRGMDADDRSHESMQRPAVAEPAERDESRHERLKSIAAGLTPLPNLFVRSASVLILLYGILVAVLIACVELGELTPEGAVIIGVAVAAFQFLCGPWVMDLMLRWIYDFSWVNLDELPPHLRAFLEKTCPEQGMKIPWMGLIHDGAPNAFTYGHTPNNMRVVITRGILDLLEEEEVEAVVAHELGHGKHWDMLLMTIAQIVPLLLYYVYRTLIRVKSTGKNDKGAGTRAAIAIGAYVLYIVSQYLVLWFSRCREYHADRFAGRVTGKPNALASALVKIAYGLAAKAGEPEEGKESKNRKEDQQRAGGIAALGAFGIFDTESAQKLVMNATAADRGQVGAENLKSAMQWDLWNPWARFYELHSTHPLVANRLRYLGEQSAAMGEEPYVVFDRRKPESYWDEFLIDVSVLMLPYLFLLAGLAVCGYAVYRQGEAALGWWMIGPPLLGLCVGSFLKILYSYRGGFFMPLTVAGLLHKVKVSAVRPVPARVKGTIIGRGVPGLIWSEDFVLQDRTGILFLDYRQPLRIWDWIFGLLRAKDYTGKKVEVTGWFRRAPVPYLELLYLKDDTGVRRAYTYWANLTAAVVFALVGAGIWVFA